MEWALTSFISTLFILMTLMFLMPVIYHTKASLLF